MRSFVTILNTPSYLSNKSFCLLEYPRVGPCRNEYHKKRLETLQLTPWKVISPVPNIYLNDMLNLMAYVGYSRFESRNSDRVKALHLHKTKSELNPNIIFDMVFK